MFQRLPLLVLNHLVDEKQIYQMEVAKTIILISISCFRPLFNYEISFIDAVKFLATPFSLLTYFKYKISDLNLH